MTTGKKAAPKKVLPINVDKNLSTSHPTEDIPHEEVKGDVLVLAPEIGKQVLKFNVTIAAVQTMVADYEALLDLDISNKENYEKVRIAVGDVVGKRTGIEARRKDLNADLILKKGYNDKASEILKGLLAPIEEKLKAKKTAHDDEVERQKEEKKRLANLVLQNRVVELIDNGIKFDGSLYSIGDTLSMDVVSIREMDDKKYAAFLEAVKTANQKIIDEQAAKDEKAEKQREADEKLRQENETKAEELRLEKEKQDKERDDLKKEKISMRTEQVEGLGFGYSVVWSQFYITRGDKTLKLDTLDVGNLTAQEWADTMANTRMKLADFTKDCEVAEKEKERIKEEEDNLKAAKLKNDARQSSRINLMLELFAMKREGGKLVYISAFSEIIPVTIVPETYYLYDDEKWRLELDDLKKRFDLIKTTEDGLQKAKEKKEEEDRVQALGDSARVKEWIAKIEALKVPEVDSVEIKTALAFCQSDLTGALTALKRQLV